MSREKKKYNPKKHHIHAVRELLDNSVMVFIKGLPVTLHYNKKTKMISQLTNSALKDELINSRHLWHVVMAVLGVNSNQEDTIEWDVLSVDTPVKQRELVDVLTKKHHEILDRCEPTEVLRFAWMAFPNDSLLSDDEMYTIFKRLRGFNKQLLN